MRETQHDKRWARRAAGVAMSALGLGVIWVLPARAESVLCLNDAELGWYDTPGSAMTIVVDGSVAYVANDAPNLLVLDVSDPESPVSLGSCSLPSGVNDLIVVGGTAYIACGRAGLQIVDVSDPSSPTALALYDTGSRVDGVDVEGDIAYIASNDGGLHIINVSHPATIPLLGVYDGIVRDVDVVGSIAYLAMGGDGLGVVEVSDPGSPILLGVCDPGNATSVTVEGAIAYTVSQGQSLKIIDVSNPVSPALVGAYPGVVSRVEIAVIGTTVYIALGRRIEVVDAGTPASPVKLGEVYTLGLAKDVAVSGAVAFVAADYGGLRIVDVSSPGPAPESPVLGTYDGVGYQLALAGTTAYVAAYYPDPGGDFGDGVIEVIDVSCPKAPAFVSAYDGGDHQFSAIEIVGTTLYALSIYWDGGTELQIVDVSDPSAPFRVGGHWVSGYDSYQLAVADNVAYATAEELGLPHYPQFVRMFDVSDSTTPTLVGEYETPSRPSALAVSGAVLYVGGDWGLQLVDVSDPATPDLLSTHETAELLRDVEVHGGIAYLVTGSTLQTIDVTDPENPSVLSTRGLPTGGQIVVEDTSAYVGGLHVINVSDPASLKLIGAWPAARVHAVSGEIAYGLGSGEFVLMDVSGDCSPHCVADTTTQGASIGDPTYGVPDGLVSAADLNFYVNGWVTDSPCADLTTQGAPIGDPLYGVPDGAVTAADLNYFVNAWIVGCP